LTCIGTVVDIKGLSFMVDCLAQGAKVQLAMDKHTALGEDLDERMAADADRAVVTACIARSLRFHEVLKHSTGDLPTCLQSLAEKAKNFEKEIGQHMLKPKQEQLQALLAETSPWASGGVDGKPWHHGLPENAELATVYSTAQTTLLTRTCEVYKARQTQLKALRNELESLSGLFGTTVSDEIEESTEAVHQSLGLSYVEGLRKQDPCHQEAP
jgi:hypothetical protein